jgi:pseudouridine synthase
MSDADLIPPSKPQNSPPETPLAEEIAFNDVEFDDVEFDDVEFEDFDPDEFEISEDSGATEPTFEPDEIGESERVSKLIARAGLASRRAAEEMIAAGRVTVNGHTISEQGTKADVLNDRIVVDGHPLRISEKPGVVMVFHKPRLVMTTKDDPGGRTTVMDFLPRKWQSLHPVGRLDFDTSGVLLLTDDGELTHLLTHPSHGAEKVYEARVRGVVEPAAIEKLERGVRLDDGPSAPCRAKVMAQRDKNGLVQLVLREGRNRQVKRMMEAVGHPVNALRRIAFAGVELEGLLPGEFRILLPAEVKALRKRVESKKKKLSAPKGKFSKPKIVKPEAIAPAEKAPFKVPHKRLERAVISTPETTTAAQRAAEAAKKRASRSKSADTREIKRPRNAPKLPEAPRLERKGSKARAISDAQKERPRTEARPRPAANPRNETRPRASEGPDSRAPKSAPRNAPNTDRSSDRSPVAKRIDKRWKS